MEIERPVALREPGNHTLQVLCTVHSNSIEFRLQPRLRSYGDITSEHVSIRREFAIPRGGYSALSTVEGLNWYIDNLLPSNGAAHINVSLAILEKLKTLLRRIYMDPQPLDKYLI